MPLMSVSASATPTAGGRPRLVPPSRWSVAGQTFALLVLVAVLVVGAGLLGAGVLAQRSATAEATARATAVAESVAATPEVVEAVQGPAPSRVLQPYAEGVRRGGTLVRAKTSDEMANNA